jgi:uncharacterized protein YndB with AHSA1/START domain
MNNLYDIKTMAITLEKIIPAPVADVYEAWLDKNCPGSPWHGVEKSIVDARLDGMCYRTHISGEGYELAHYGRFTALVPHERIQFTWVSQHTRGLESLVTVSFAERGAQTLLTIHHENLPDDEKGRLHVPGWTYYLEGLESNFAGKAMKVQASACGT